MTSPLSTNLVVGASSGIGRSLALALARERKNVALVGRSEERLARVAQEVAMFGGEPLVLLSDVRDPISIQAALAQIVLRNQRIETAFLSSGLGLATDTESFTVDTLNEMLQTQCAGRGPLAGSLAAPPASAAGRGDSGGHFEFGGRSGHSRRGGGLFGE